MALGADQTAALDRVTMAGRLAVAAVLLRGAAHRAAAWLVEEPRLEVKLAMTEHRLEDVLAVQSLEAGAMAFDHGIRLPAAASRDVASPLMTLDRAADPREFLDLCVDGIRPGIVALLEQVGAGLDPRRDESTLRAVTSAVRAQLRMVDELPAPDVDEMVDRARVAVDLMPGVGVPTEPPIRAAPATPGRDAFVEKLAFDPHLPPSDPSPAAQVHDALDDLLCLIELVSRAAHSSPGAPWRRHVALAAAAAAGAQAAGELDGLLAGELAMPWGSRPVALTVWHRGVAGGGGDVPAAAARIAAQAETWRSSERRRRAASAISPAAMAVLDGVQATLARHAGALSVPDVDQRQAAAGRGLPHAR